jgi:hypothetical protein
MFLQGVIEVIISLVFTWFVLSTATVQIQEWIAARFQWRARDLENAVAGMLNDRGLTKLFYDHPIIRSLSAKEEGRTLKPSYIPAQQFSTVLLSIILAAGSESALLIYSLYNLPDQLKRIQSREKRKKAQADLTRILELARLASSTQSGTAIDNLILATLEKELTSLGDRNEELKDFIAGLRQKAAIDREQIEKLSGSLPDEGGKSEDLRSLLKGTLALGVINPGLRLALNSLLIGIDKPETSEADFLGRLQTNIETWFNDTMDRLSGWYKRKAQLGAFLIGLTAALLLNVDTIQLATQLWKEPALREAISANTELIVQQYSENPGSENLDPISALQNAQEQYLGLPVGWNFNAVQLMASESCAFAPASGQVFGFNWYGECRRPFGASASTNGWAWMLIKLAGLLMTAVASAQGSSFWFDVLMKVVNVRSAGIKPAG